MGRKRAHGEGSITKLNSGYRARVYIAGERKTKNFRTKTEALSWITETVKPFKQGLSYDAMHIDLTKYLESWLINKKAEIKPKTHYHYTQLVRSYIEPAIGSILLNELRPSHIQEFYNRKIREGSGPRTIRLIHNILHNVFNQAVKEGMMIRNLSDATSPPKYQPDEIKVINENDRDKLLLAVEGHKFEAIIYLAIFAGARKGELLGLKWEDLDWSSGQLHICRQVQQIPGKGVILSSLKTKRSNRTVVIANQTLVKLAEQFEQQQIQRLKTGSRWQDNNLIFPSSIGTPLVPSNFDRAWRDIKAKASVRCRFHDLVHLYASMMLVQLRKSHTEVAANMGHSRASTTLDMYSHMIPGLGYESASELEDLVLSSKPIKDNNDWPKIGPKSEKVKLDTHIYGQKSRK